MEGEATTPLSHSPDQSKNSFETISILVVDDDTTCLSIVAAILKKFRYEVVTVKHPNDALCTLRIKGDAFDLVVSDVHMPDMNGFELQQTISQEFDLPVVLMSGDDQDGVALKGLDSGAAFFIVKPVTADDLRDLWQFAAMKKKSQVVIEETQGSFPEGKTSSTNKKNNSDHEIIVSASSVNAETPKSKKDSKRKSPKKEGSDEKNGENSQKKPKVVWTNSLHNRFLEAIRSIGLERAVPKKILEVMNVPGLTRENVASHLQKYRIFLRRVSDASYKLQCVNDKGLSKTVGSSSFASSSSSTGTSTSTLMLSRLDSNQNPGHFPNYGASSGSFSTPSVCGQSRLLSGKESFLKPNIGSTNLMYQPDYVRLAQSSYQPIGSSIPPHFTSPGIHSCSQLPVINPETNYQVSPHNNIMTNNITPVPSQNFMYQTNYVGYQISNLKHLAEPRLGERNEGLINSCGGAVNLPVNDFENSNSVDVAALMANDSVNLDQLGLDESSSFGLRNSEGGQLSDVLADCNTLFPANLPFSPMLDFTALFDVMPNQECLEEGDFSANFADQLNIENQEQQNGGNTITSSNFYSNTSHWENLAHPIFDQAPNQLQNRQGTTDPQEFSPSSQINDTLLPSINQQQGREDLTNSLEFNTSQLINETNIPPSTEGDDDDYLEALLAPFRDDHTPGEISETTGTGLS